MDQHGSHSISQVKPGIASPDRSGLEVFNQLT
jgi:hypothetical protein